ncbi:MAG: DNA-binding protein [Lachnospiraceae bacterium]
MFYNLRNALTHRGLTIKQYAEVLGVGNKTIQNKMADKTDFTYPEFKKTCALLSEYNADYLFAQGENGRAS